MDPRTLHSRMAILQHVHHHTCFQYLWIPWGVSEVAVHTTAAHIAYLLTAGLNPASDNNDNTSAKYFLLVCHLPPYSCPTMFQPHQSSQDPTILQSASSTSNKSSDKSSACLPEPLTKLQMPPESLSCVFLHPGTFPDLPNLPSAATASLVGACPRNAGKRTVPSTCAVVFFFLLVIKIYSL